MTPDRPQWHVDNEPHSQGIQILIPNPQELHQFVVQQASNSGDKTRAELKRDYAEWLIGQRPTEPNSLTWGIPMDGVLFAQYEINLSSGYSPYSGEWSDLVSFLWMDSVDKSWEVPKKAEVIHAILKGKGLNAQLEVDHDEDYHIFIPNTDETAVFSLGLGQKYIEDAVELYGWNDVNESGNNPFILLPKKMSLKPTEFTKNLAHFQEMVPHAISALYEAFDMPTPQVALELTIANSGLQR